MQTVNDNLYTQENTVSVVADMRFRGVASLNQVGVGTEGHSFGVGEQEKRGPKGREHGGGELEKGQPVSLPTS